MKLSVVLTVYNDEERIAATIGSILVQTEPDFELIVVDDGSTDATPRILAQLAQGDARVRIITQPNAGITHALIRGCDAARAEVIARHDSGDRSHPERFRLQLAELRDDVVMVSCATHFVAPEEEPLYVTDVDPDDVRESLLHDDASKIHGVVHAAVMFRRSAYLEVGGYREQFYFAQDLDLWVRLAPLGCIAAAREPLYVAIVHPRSISAVNHDRQSRLKAIIVALRDGGPREELLAEAATIRPRQRAGRRGEARGLYFIGRVLRHNGDPRARGYFALCVARDPLHLRAWLSLISGR